MMTKTFLKSSLALAAVAALLAGCGSDNSKSSPSKDSTKTQSTTTESSTTQETTSSNVEFGIAAIELAEKETPGVAYELDESGRRGWELDVARKNTSVEMRINAEGTKVERVRDIDQLDTIDRRRIESIKVAMADAVRTASAEIHDGSLDTVELDRHRTTLVWLIEFDEAGNDVDVSVDVATGKVVDVERD